MADRAGETEYEMEIMRKQPTVRAPADTFTGDAVDGDLHAAYHAKYDRYGPSIVGTVVSAEAVGSTLRLVPR